MQYYRDGFYPGDPRITPSAPITSEKYTDHGAETVDVLIVGAGPAGLVLAAQLARFPHISTLIVDRQEGPMILGRADGVACRTLEMFAAFGVSHQVLAESYWVNETTFWGPGVDGSGIARQARVQDVADGLSEMPHVILSQARIHDHLLFAMHAAPASLEPRYGWELIKLEVGGENEPVVVSLKDKANRRHRTVHARYVVGCDGARSRVRTQIDRKLNGDPANHAWGVLDVLAVSDFPDFRRKASIQAEDGSSILLIPREGGYMTRLYVDLGTVSDANRVAIRSIGPDAIVSQARRVFSPYSLDIQEIVWSSVYEVAQRICDGFDDGVSGDVRSKAPRVFIAGDACHTHSAKAGQGMNVSMQDAFNLGWKLAAVLEGSGHADLLQTYDEERRPVAQELIDFDREWSTMLTTPRAAGDPGLADYFERQGRYTAGVATTYPGSRLISRQGQQQVATGYPIGQRFQSAPVTRICDSLQMELGHQASADGRWKLYAFCGESMEPWRQCLNLLADSPVSPTRTKRNDFELRLDVYGIVRSSVYDVELGNLPQILRPRVGNLGLTDVERAFAIQTTPSKAQRLPVDIFELRGIHRDGALVLVRPDQYVADVQPLRSVQLLLDFILQAHQGDDDSTVVRATATPL